MTVIYFSEYCFAVFEQVEVFSQSVLRFTKLADVMIPQ